MEIVLKKLQVFTSVGNWNETNSQEALLKRITENKYIKEVKSLTKTVVENFYYGHSTYKVHVEGNVYYLYDSVIFNSKLQPLGFIARINPLISNFLKINNINITRDVYLSSNLPDKFYKAFHKNFISVNLLIHHTFEQLFLAPIYLNNGNTVNKIIEGYLKDSIGLLENLTITDDYKLEIGEIPEVNRVEENNVEENAEPITEEEITAHIDEILNDVENTTLDNDYVIHAGITATEAFDRAMQEAFEEANNEVETPTTELPF